MITSSTVVYTVQDKELGFSAKTPNKSHAERIEKNLQETKRFIQTLNKYYQPVSKSSQADMRNSDYDYSEIPEYTFTNEGIFNGVLVRCSSTHYDSWDGRPPISDSWEKKISKDAFREDVLKNIIYYIESMISVYENGKTLKRLHNNALYKINKELEILNNDLKILQSV